MSTNLHPITGGSVMNLTMEASRGLAPLQTRVLRSLQRTGFPDLEVEHVIGGHVRITGPVASESDRAIAIAVARTVPAVTEVSFERG